MTPQYLPTTPEGKIARLTEECGEVLQIIGKIGRFGLKSYSPEDPLKLTNDALLMMEMADLEHAINEMRAVIHDVWTQENASV